MNDDRIIAGTNTVTMSLGGKLFELAPLGPKMTAQMIAEMRRRAIQEFHRTAKECGMSFDLIKSQLDRFNNIQSAGELVTPDALAYLLWLRTKHSGVTLEECEAVPQREIEAMEAEILDLNRDLRDYLGLLQRAGMDIGEALEDPDKAAKAIGEAFKAWLEKKI